MPFTPNNTPKTYQSPGSGSGYGSYYNPANPQFYKPKQPSSYKPPSNPNAPTLTPGNATAPPKPLGGSPYPNLKPPYKPQGPFNYKPPSNPNAPTLTPGNATAPPKPLGGSPYPNLKPPVSLPKVPALPSFKPISPLGGGLARPGGMLPGGGVAGGLATAAALLWAYNFYQLHKLWNLSQPESKPTEEPGQIPNIRYGISYTVYTANQPPSTFEQTTDIYLIVWGEYKGYRYFDNPETNSIELQFLCRGKVGNGTNPYTGATGPSPELIWVFGNASRARDQLGNVTIKGIRRLDDNNQPLPETPPQLQRQPQPQPLPQLQAQPQPREPLPQLTNLKLPKLETNPTPNLKPNPQKPPIRLNIPDNQPITITSPGNPPLVVNQVPPKATPDQPKLPEQPTEIKFPRTTPPGQPQPVEIKPPGKQPLTFTTPGNTPITVNIPGYQPITVDPTNTSKPTGATPQLLVPGSFIPTPTTPTTPKPTPTPTTPATPEPESPNVLIPATILATLTPLLQQLLANTNPANIEPVVTKGVCKTTQPGGCMSNLTNDVAKKANDDLFNRLNTGANLAQLALLPIINNKLGPQVNGGLSGFLGRLSNSLGIDRALNLIGIASNLHNAMMLSASLKVTLLEMLSSVGNATGLLQTSENENVDLNQVFNQGIETFMVTIMGTENYAGLKVGLRKYNAIYRAATNSLNATSQMFNSIGEALETAAEYTGKIGNALRAASVVRENAYNFMSERITVKTSKFMTFQNKVGSVTQVLETINEIAENVVEGQEQYTEAIKATDEFKKALADADRPVAVDNKLIKAEAEKIKANLVKDPTGEDETGLLSFLTDR